MIYISGINELRKHKIPVSEQASVLKQPRVPEGHKLFVFYYDDCDEAAIDVTEPKKYAQVMGSLTAKNYPELCLVKDVDVENAGKNSTVCFIP